LKEKEGDNTIPFDTIQEQVGLVFCMQDYETIEMLKRLAETYSDYFAYSDVAGIRQIQFTNRNSRSVITIISHSGVLGVS
jgi:hypothetical protein